MRPLRVAAVLMALCRVAAAKEDPDTEIARRHYDHGRELYDLGQYREAVAEFESANQLKRSAAFDYNIARCYDRLEEPQKAIEAYERYLTANPDDAGEVRQRVEVLRQRVRSIPKPEPPSPPPPRPISAAPKRRISAAWPAALLAPALAALVTGGALYGVSGQKYDDLLGSGCGRTMVCLEDRYSSTRQMEQAGIGLLIAGGVLAATDVVLWAVWAKRKW